MGRNYVANLRKIMLYNANGDLVNDNVYTKVLLNSVHSFSRHIKSIKSVTLLQICEKMTLCNPNVDLVNANMCIQNWAIYFYSFLRYGAKTIFLCQSQSRAVTLLQICKKTLYNANIDLVNDNVYTNFLMILSKNKF